MRLSTLFAVIMTLAMTSMASAGATGNGAAATATSRPEKQIAQQCLEDLQRFDVQLWRVGLGVLAPAMVPSGTYGESAPTGYTIWGVNETPRQKIRSLRDAAYRAGAVGGPSELREDRGSQMGTFVIGFLGPGPEEVADLAGSLANGNVAVSGGRFPTCSD